MAEPSNTGHALRHREVDEAAFDARMRLDMNVAVDGPGHQPYLDYTPAAWRHYTRRLALLDRLKRIDFSSALDVGCAEGYLTAAIGEAHQAEMWGVDISERAAAAAASRYGMPAAAAHATALPFADGAFDLVFSTEVIEHVLDPDTMLAEMRRVSRRYVLVTTPVSQSEDAREPDYEIRSDGHINYFDEVAIRRLFGPEADLRTFRCNLTFALLTAFGRKLPAGFRDFFYQLDHRFAKRFGSPHNQFVPLRNRDWIVFTPAAPGDVGPREWRCPRCRGELAQEADGLRCLRDNVSFPFAAPGVPDFISPR